jgi:hypothetical protein
MWSDVLPTKYELLYSVHPGFQESHQLARIQKDNGGNFGETQAISQCHG